MLMESPISSEMNEEESDKDQDFVDDYESEEEKRQQKKRKKVKTVYRGTSLFQPPLGIKKVAGLVRCQHFRDSSHTNGLYVVV